MTQRLFYIATLGCKVNQYESQALREAWRGLGHVETLDPAAADLVLVNSCAVTAKAVADVRATVRRLHKAAPGASIILSGCAAEVAGDELARLPGVTQVFGKDAKALLPGGASIFSDLAAPPLAAAPPLFPAASPPAAPERVFPPFFLSGSERSRAALKIQDGCSHGCTYCIVPLARGRSVSRPRPESLAEAARLLENGFREIVISGVNLRQYREGAGGSGDFWRFVKALDAALSPEWAGRARLRISSLEPGQLGDLALETLSSCRMLAPHLHLSLQSGSPSVLRRMGRGHYSPETMPDFLADLRGFWPVFGLGADILTGFPGESDAEHRETVEFCRMLPLSYAHVFPYSKRPGTPAAAMPGQVPQDLKKSRAAELRHMVNEKKLAFAEGMRALPEVHVVFEDRGQDAPMRGVNEYYVDCLLPGGGQPPKRLVPCRPVGLKKDLLLVSCQERCP